MADFQRLEIGTLLSAAKSRIVFTSHLRQAVVVVIFDLEHLEAVHVGDDLETGDRVRVRIAVWRPPHPQIAPAQPARQVFTSILSGSLNAWRFASIEL